MFRKWRFHKRCRRLAAASRAPVLREYLESCAALKPGQLGDTPMIAADLELTGLDAATNHIISIGWTLIDEGRIRVGSNRHLLISAGQSVGSSAAIHELTDTEVAEGMDLAHGLEALFADAAGRVWVFHHAALDVAFLQQACYEWAGVAPAFQVLDTMQIELALRQRRNRPVQQGDLQLGRLRSEYHLPRYTAHDALIDAFATAELLLAIGARMDRRNSLGLAPHIAYF